MLRNWFDLVDYTNAMQNLNRLIGIMDHSVATQIDDSLIMNYTALLCVVINV